MQSHIKWQSILINYFTMQYSTIVEHSEEGLQMIFEAASNFERESILDGILLRKYTAFDIEQMIATVTEAHSRLMREANALAHFAMSFNRQFATDNNKCFDVAEKMFRKIRSSVSGSKKIYKSFCKTMRQRFPGVLQNKKASVFTHSILATGVFTRDLFGEESFPKVVKELCDSIESFFADLIQIIRVCMQVSEEEKKIKDDPKMLEMIYNSDCAVLREQQRGIVSSMLANRMQFPIDPMTKQKKTHSLQAFLRESYHKFSRSELIMHTTNEAIEKGHNDGLDATESTLWPDRHDLVPQIRIIINHFDELNPKGQFDKQSGKYKINGEIMARLVKWCYLEGTHKEKLFVESYFPTHYNGIYQAIKANTVNSAKNKFTRQGNDPGYDEFVKNIEALLAKYELKEPKVRLAVMNS